MSVARILPSGGANDFNVSLSGSYTRVTFSKEFPPGGYSIVSSLIDSTLDIYTYNQDGSSAGYTSTKSFTATKGFNKMVIIGGTFNDLLSFTYKQTFITEAESDEVTAGPVLTSLSTSSLPNINDTVTLTGRNFAPDMTVTFTGTNATALNAKSIVIGTTTSAVITRPDNLSTAYSPYTVTISNPGINDPVGSSSHIASNAINAGASPVWSTSASLPAFTKNISYSQTVLATDADAGTTITYSVVSNGLPAGLTFASTSGVISGTPTDVTTGTITVRATDAGGNYVDRTFTIPNVGTLAPTWSTGATLPGFLNGAAYSQSLVATDDSGLTPTYSFVSGTLPSGITFTAASGLVSGTPSGNSIGFTGVFTIRATDTNGTYTDRTFTLPSPIVGVFTASSSLTMPSTKNLKVLCVGAGDRGSDGHNPGAGSGYVRYYQIGSVSSGTTITASVGGFNGGTTTLTVPGVGTYTANGGSGSSGGSGGGGSGNSGYGGTGGSNGSNGNNGATIGGGSGQGVPFPLASVQYPAVNYGFTAGSGGSASGGSHCGGGGGGGVTATNAVGFTVPSQSSSGLGGQSGAGFGGGGGGGGYNGNYYGGTNGQSGMIYLWEY